MGEELHDDAARKGARLAEAAEIKARGERNREIRAQQRAVSTWSGTERHERPAHRQPAARPLGSPGHPGASKVSCRGEDDDAQSSATTR